MGRLKQELLDRTDSFADRVLDVVEVLEGQRRWGWLRDQLGRAGASVGANAVEADQAMSRSDFCKCLGVSAKEASETRYWLRRLAGRGWIKPGRLAPLEAEAFELQRIFASMISRTRRTSKA